MTIQALRSRLILGAVLLAILCPTVVLATSFSWTSTGGQFNAAANWTQSGFPADLDGIPDANDTVTFNRGNVTQYPVYFGDLLVPFSGIHPTVDRVVIGNNPLNFVGLYGSTLAADSTNITETGRGVVIGSGAGDVAALTSTLATFDTQYATLGGAAGSSGTLNLTSPSAGAFSVSGTGATYDLIVGLNGTGTIDVTNGRDVTVADDTVLGQNATGVGNVTVSGMGSTWTNAGDLLVGLSGTGTLDVTDGGQVSSDVSYLGRFDGSTGIATVSGASSLWQNTILAVGDHGGGTLNITNGGHVTNTFGRIGYVTDCCSGSGSGTVTVDGVGSTWTNTASLAVSVGNAAMLEVTHSGEVTVGDYIVMNSLGQIHVSDSLLTASGELYVIGGSLTAEANAAVSFAAGTLYDGTSITVKTGASITHSGAVDVVRDATVQVNSAGKYQVTGLLKVGTQPGPASQLIVDGQGTKVSSNFAIDVGYGGTGIMTVTGGGRVETGTGAIGSYTTGSVGTVTLDGTDVSGIPSAWVSTAGINMGLDATSQGTLSILNGALFAPAALTVGYFGTCSVLVDGTHAPASPSRLNTTILQIAGSIGNGNGQVTASNGGRIDVANLEMASTGGTATLTISGANSTLVQSGASTTTVGHTTNGSATINVLNGGLFDSGTGAIAINQTGSMTLDGTTGAGTFTADGAMTVHGSVQVGSSSPGAGGMLKVNTGLAVDGGTVHLLGGVVDANTITLANGGTFAFDGGTLHVENFNGNLLNQGGTLAPGHSIGATAVSGNYTQRPAAAVEIEVGGVLPGQWDVLAAGGNASLSGTIKVLLRGDFEPVLGNSFTIITTTAGNVGGQFVTKMFPIFNGLTFDVVYNPKSVVLQVIVVPLLPGDYNQNGIVDAADYVVWRRNQGTTNSLPNDLVGGTIGNAQYDQWRSHFGQTAGSGSGTVENVTVPEPATITMLIIVTLVTCTLDSSGRSTGQRKAWSNRQRLAAFKGLRS